MHLRVSAPGLDLDEGDVDQITRDLEKIDRRLQGRDEVYSEVSINGKDAAPDFMVTLKVEFGRNHLIAKGQNGDMNVAVREAREDLLRQINDRSRRGHSDFSKRP